MSAEIITFAHVQTGKEEMIVGEAGGAAITTET